MSQALGKIETRFFSEFFCLNAYEVMLIEQEIDQYFPDFLSIEKGSVVFDVGANIGMFSSAIVNFTEGDVDIYAFEPIPAVYAVLEANTKVHLGPRVHAFPFGLSDHPAEVELDYFPKLTVHSSAYRSGGARAEEQARITTAFVELIKQGQVFPELSFLPREDLVQVAGGMLVDLWASEAVRCELRTLSQVIRAESVRRIDLLKVDAEGAEISILRGIEDEHWPMIQQVVVEIEGWEKNAATAARLLADRGFEVREGRDDAVQQAADFGLLYARR